jgi:Family of unknown function (DUF6188)
MCGLPQGIDLGFFVGQTVDQICIGLHEILLNFSGKVSVQIESQYRFTDHLENRSTFESTVAGAPLLLSLLSIRIAAAEGNGGTLKLSFEGGATLEVLDSSEHYESYHIRNGAASIVV